MQSVVFKKKSGVSSQGQSHYIEVAQGAIFMEQNMRFGLILSWLTISTEKKNWANYEQLLTAVFFMSSWAKKVL